MYTTTNKLLFCIEKSPKNSIFYDTNLLQDVILTHFVRNIARIKNIFTSGYFELILFKISGVIFVRPQPSRMGLKESLYFTG